MRLPQQGRRIVWLVRLLAAIGLAMVVITTGLVGWTLARVRAERARATVEESRLDQASRALRETAVRSRMEIRTVLDETAARTNQQFAVAGLDQLICAQMNPQPDPTVAASLRQLRTHAARVAESAGRAAAWRTSYSPVWDDLVQQNTLGRVRDLMARLRTAVEAREGKQRLDEAIKYRQWRKTGGEEAARLAGAILTEQARRQSRESGDFKNHLAELAQLVELLGGEERFDSLADLKDNKLKPVLDRISRSIAVLAAEQAGEETLTPRAIEDLKVALFGESYVSDDAHQNVQAGRGGLFTLRRDALSLRRDREKLKNEVAVLFQDLETANASFAQCTQARAAALTHQMERSLASGWREMLVFGGGCSVLFLWLAWVIARGIDGQVRALEHARAEAEQGRQTTQKLMLEQQAAAAQLAAAHQGLQTSEQRFRTLCTAAPMGIFLTDAAGAALYTNSAWQKIAGIPLAESLGDGWQRAVHPDDAAAVFSAWQSAACAGRGYDREFRFRTPEGEVRWVHARSSAIHSETGAVTGHVGMVQDITERKGAEAELEKAHKELVDVSRQAGMAEVAIGVLHNLGNVLNSVNVSANLLADKLRKSRAPSLTRVCDLLKQHAGRLGEFLTNDRQGQQVPAFLEAVAGVLTAEQAAMLDEVQSLNKNVDHIKDIVSMQQTFARLVGCTEPVHLSELIEDTLRLDADSLTRHAIEVVKDIAPGLMPVQMDKHKTLQILVNLICNAKHACIEGRRMDKRITVRAGHDGDRLRIVVADNGAGILPENLQRIFNHGFTTKKDGHGFGLHSGANAAKEMGGSLTVQSDGPGQGAAFTLELPLERVAAAKAPTSDTPGRRSGRNAGAVIDA